MKNLRILLAFAFVLTLLASCKKSDPTTASILTSHKWVLSTSTRQISGDTNYTINNLRYDTLPCQQDGYREFRDYLNNTAQRSYYDYAETKCLNETSDVTTGYWDLDKDNAFISFSGSGSTQTYSWKITSIDGSKMVLTATYTTSVTVPTNTSPYYRVVTRTITDQDTWSTK
ncbi:MAG: lipocalin family protein [Bacteroidetes bacterium]|nr:lipocalin family protein [Bacteroidota bacterium]